MLKRTFIIMAYLLLAATLLIALYIAYAWTINWHDRPPSQTSIQLHKEFDKIHSQEEKDNGYGFLFEFTMKTNLQKGDILQFRKTCSNNRDCISAIFYNEELLESILSEYDWLTQRYAEVVAHTGYADTNYSHNEAIPPFSDVLVAQKLYLIKLLRPDNKMSTEEIRQALNRDIRFWRIVMKDSATFISKLVAVAALENHFYITNDLYRRLSNEAVAEILPESLFTPLSKEELSLRRVMVGEWMYGNELLKDISPSSTEGIVPPLDRLVSFNTFQPQDTINRSADITSAYIAHFERPLENYPLAKQYPPNIETQDGMWSLLLNPYNLSGRMLTAISLPAYENYFLKVGDVEVTRRALTLILQMRQEGITPEEAPDFIAESHIKHPYKGESFQWDAKQQALIFLSPQTAKNTRSSYAY